MILRKVSYRKGRNIGNVSFALIHMVLKVFLTCILVKEKVLGKTDCVTFVSSCTFNTLLTFLT